MRMQEAMAALNGGQTVDARAMLGGANTAPADDGAGSTSTQDHSERQVSLG